LPVVAFDGTNYLVVWSQQQSDVIGAALVSRSGVVLNRFDIAVRIASGNLLAPDVAYGGGTFLVTWDRQTYTDEGEQVHELRGARVGTDGVVQDPDGFLVTDRIDGSPYDLAFGGTDFLVVWQESGLSGSDIHGTRVTTAGTIPTPDGFPIAADDSQQITPRLAWNGVTNLVVWTSFTGFDPNNSDIYGARVDGSGTVLDPSGIAIATGPGQKSGPTVAANGPFLVTWNDRRRGSVIEDLFATRVDADGSVAHPDGFPLMSSADGYPGYGAVIAAGPVDGDFTLLYSRNVPEQPFGTNRAFVRKVSPK
jgi:hypothetical protein